MVDLELVKGYDAADAVAEWQNLLALRQTVHGLANPFEPGPEFVSWGNFAMNAKKGLTTEITKGKGDNATAETIWVASPFEVIGACRDPHGRGWGKWLCWRDADGRIHTRHVADAALQGDPSALCGGLADEGLSINRNQQRALLTYLSGCNVEGRVTLVHRTGWHDIGSHQVFVLPSETIGPNDSEHVILDASAAGPYEALGTLKDWQDDIGALASGHALPVLAISAAFAGPLLQLAGQEGGGVHIFGGSSKGKTTLLQIAASVWGRGASPGYVRAWRATANGLEGVAASASDTVLILDELSVVEARDAAPSFYGLANGSGKARAARDGSLREPKTWRVLILSSGEIPTGTKLAEDRGRKARAGNWFGLSTFPPVGAGVLACSITAGLTMTLARSPRRSLTAKTGVRVP
jgi:putative DNA primase/helicase